MLLIIVHESTSGVTNSIVSTARPGFRLVQTACICTLLTKKIPDNEQIDLHTDMQ